MNSHAQDSTRSFNQATKEDTNSSCNITERSRSDRKCSQIFQRKSSWVYYGTFTDSNRLTNSPRGSFFNSFGINSQQYNSKAFSSLVSEFSKITKNLNVEKLASESNDQIYDKLKSDYNHCTK